MFYFVYFYYVFCYNNLVYKCKIQIYIKKNGNFDFFFKKFFDFDFYSSIIIVKNFLYFYFNYIFFDFYIDIIILNKLTFYFFKGNCLNLNIFLNIYFFLKNKYLLKNIIIFGNLDYYGNIINIGDLYKKIIFSINNYKFILIPNILYDKFFFNYLKYNIKKTVNILKFNNLYDLIFILNKNLSV